MSDSGPTRSTRMTSSSRYRNSLALDLQDAWQLKEVAYQKLGSVLRVDRTAPSPRPARVPPRVNATLAATTAAQARTPGQSRMRSYLVVLRAREMTRLFHKTHHSVHHITRAVGWTNKTHSAKQLRKLTGYTPAKYRSKARSQAVAQCFWCRQPLPATDVDPNTRKSDSDPPIHDRSTRQAPPRTNHEDLRHSTSLGPQYAPE